MRGMIWGHSATVLFGSVCYCPIDGFRVSDFRACTRARMHALMVGALVGYYRFRVTPNTCYDATCSTPSDHLGAPPYDVRRRRR